MASSPDNVCQKFAGKKVKLTIRSLGDEEETVLIEGERTGLEFLGQLLLAQAQYAKDCGFQLDPQGAGKVFFTKESTRGIYIHRLHRAPVAKVKSNGAKKSKKSPVVHS
jgi:hypothetical protein